MSLMYEVPVSVQRASQRALSLHQESALADVSGIALADQLASGRCTIEQVGRIHRFHETNARLVVAEAQLMHTAQDSPLVRSFELHGAEAGQRWAAKIIRAAVAEGYELLDSTTALLKRTPDEIYDAFSLGAWRFEYDLSPQKAARFLEHYHRASGWNLDLRRAFGESAGAVGNALQRRIHGPDPFQEAARAMEVQDAEYRMAAELDLADISEGLEEGLAKQTFTGANATLSAKMVWPAFVAYVILAVERPELLVDMNMEGQKPPQSHQTPKPWTAYNDPVNTFIAYFHPDGARFHDPVGEKSFDKLLEDAFDLMHRAYYGKKVQAVWAQRLLGRMRRWTAQNKLAGSLFHVYNADWKKANWQHILDAIPPDADVRPYFAKFASDNPMPVSGIKLQQTLSDKKLKEKVHSYLKSVGAVDKYSKAFELMSVKLDATLLGKQAKQSGTPLGIYTSIKVYGKQAHILGAFSTINGGVDVVSQLASGEFMHDYDGVLRNQLKSGALEVLQAHKDMPGSTYGAIAPKSPTPITQTADALKMGSVPATVEGIPGAVYLDLKKDVSSSLLASVMSIPFSETQLHSLVEKSAAYKGTVHKDALWLWDALAVATYRMVAAYSYVTEFGKTKTKSFAFAGPVQESAGETFLHMSDEEMVSKFLDGTFRPHQGAAIPETPTPPAKDFAADGIHPDFLEFATKSVAILKSSTGADDIDMVSLMSTVAGEKFKKTYFKDLALGEKLIGSTGVIDILTHSGKVLSVAHDMQLQVGGALRDEGAGSDWILLRVLPTHTYYLVKSSILAPLLAPLGTFYLVPAWAKGAVGGSQDMVQSPTPQAIPDPKPFGFKQGDVIDWNGTWIVLGSTALDYALQPALIGPLTKLSIQPSPHLRDAVDQEAKLIASIPFGPLGLWKHLSLPGGLSKDSSPPGDFVVGEFVQDYDTYMVVGGVTDDTDGTPYLVRALSTTVSVGSATYDAWQLSLKPFSEMVTQESSYAPPAEMPENSHESDEPDPEQDNYALSGTQEAFDWLEKKGWTPATPYDSGVIAYGLGEVRAYKSGSTRLIIGYGLNEAGSAIYVIKTEKGNVNWVTCLNAHKKYGGVISHDNAVLAALLPKPGSAEVKPKYPRLNYTLSRLGKKVAANHGLTYAPRPKDSKPKFHVNTPLIKAFVNSIIKYELVGYLEGPDSTSAILAVTDDWNGQTTVAYLQVSIGDLNSQYRTFYPEGTVSNFKTGEHAWGKEESEPGITLNLSTGLVPSAVVAGWDEPTPVKQPVFGELPDGKHASAGVVVIVPPGTGVSGAKGVGEVQFPSIICYDPIGRFGGYKLCLPKGSLDKGEAIAKAAVREVWEETGLTVKPIAHLGDYRANKSMNRFFIGHVTGGNPKKKTQPDESAIVRMFPLTTNSVGAPIFQEEEWFQNLIPKSGSKWQQKVVMNAWKWIMVNGMPDTVRVDAADYDCMVTGPDDTSATDATGGAILSSDQISSSINSALGAPDPYSDAAFAQDPTDISAPPETPKHAIFKPTIPADSFGDNVWKSLYFKCPFPVTDAMVAQLKSKVKSGEATKPLGFDASRDRPDGPNFGEAFETKVGTPYTAAGYVSWMGDDGNAYHFLLVWSPAGSVDAISCGPEGVPGSHVLDDQTAMQQDLDAWFQHDDPETNALIKSVYATGTLPKGVTMATFKTKWCKQAGVPAYAVITKPVLRDVASMFVQGACSQQQHDAIVASLKARMAQTHKKNTSTAPVVTDTLSASPPRPTLGMPLSTAPKKIQPPAHFESPLYTQYVDVPQPILFKSTSQKLPGGSKPNGILTGPGGKQWFAKWHSTEKHRAEFDRAGYQFSQLCKGNNVPVGVMDVEVNGTTRHVSFQPLVENSGHPPVDPRELNGDNQAELLSQHAADCFMGDHDGHAANWVMQKNGQLAAVDRGQAMKFIWQGTAESLDPFWNAPGNIPQLGNEQSYAKHLLKLWAKGKAEIPAVAWAEMRKTIEKVLKVSDAQIEAIVSPVGKAMGKPDVATAKVVATLLKRRDQYLKNWTLTLKKLRKDFEWPAAAGAGAKLNLPSTAFKSSPEALGFGTREEATIQEAVAAGWQGKSLKIDKDAIEGQEVLCHRVMYQEKPGVSVPATMISFRVSRPAGLDATVKAVKNKDLAVGVDLTGPHRLKADASNGLFEKIWASIKSVNFHLAKQKDLDINVNTIASMNQIEPTLQALVKATEDSSGTYAATGEPNEAVYAMAEQYLQYLGVVNYWVDNKAELLGQHSPKLVEFLWEDPPEEAEATDKPKPSFKVSMKKSGALWPTVNPVDQKNLTVTNLNKPVMNSGQQSQFVIEDPVTKARVFFNPPGGLTSVMSHAAVGQVGIKDGVESLKGQCWAIIPGEPSSATVAHLLTLVQSALGIDTSVSTPDDEAVLYWSRQASILQGSGAVSPLPDHTTVKEVAYQEAMSKYKSGDSAGAVADLQKFVAKKSGMTVAEVRKHGSKEEVEGHYTRDAGRFRHHRIGWTRESLSKKMGATCHVAHNISDSPQTWMKHMALNGALISNATKAYFGVTKTGASPGADMLRGGGQGLFCCFRKGFSTHTGMLYFDISLALRTDLYIVGTGDTYGDTGKTRYTTPEQWTKMGANTQSGHCGASSGQQISVRHDIDIRQYLVRVSCGSKTAAAACVKIAKDLGWTFYGGKKPEDVFVS